MIIIGITGTIGAGKGTIVDFLVEKYGFNHLSVRQFLIDGLKAKGELINRDTMVKLANELRAANKPSYITDCLYQQALSSGKNCIIESIRTPGEVYSLKEAENFFLFAVDAFPETRFERIKIRNSETDSIDFETFVENEKREMTSTNPNHQNLKKCIELANFVFDNNGSITDLHLQIKEVITKIEENI
jgi:dephospho-CoA kinase